MNDRRESLEKGLLLVERERERWVLWDNKFEGYGSRSEGIELHKWTNGGCEFVSVLLANNINNDGWSSWKPLSLKHCNCHFLLSVSGFSLLFGMALWPTLRRKAIQKGRHSNEHRDFVARLGMFPYFSTMDFHGTRPFDFSRSREIHFLYDPRALCLRGPSASRSVLPIAELNLPLVVELSRLSLLPRGSLLGPRVPVRGRACRGGFVYWLNVVLLFVFSRALCHVALCWVLYLLSSEVFCGLQEFFRFAFPSAVMACLEWWSFELLTLLSGFLPNPELEASVLSTCLSTMSTLYTIPEGLGAAGSTRVANELGAGNARAARRIVGLIMSLALSEALLLSSVLFGSKRAFGHIFSDDKEVVSSVLVGIPIAAALGFWWDLRGKGLRIGIMAGSFMQTCLLFLVTFFTNWENKAKMARERIFQGRSLEEDNIGVVTEQRALLS